MARLRVRSPREDRPRRRAASVGRGRKACRSAACWPVRPGRPDVAGWRARACRDRGRPRSFRSASMAASRGGRLGHRRDGAGNVWLNTALGIFRLPSNEIEQALRDPSHAVVAERFDYPRRPRRRAGAVAAGANRRGRRRRHAVVRHEQQRRLDRPGATSGAMRSPRRRACSRSKPAATPGRCSAPTLPVGTRSVDLHYTAGAFAQPERVTLSRAARRRGCRLADAGSQRSARYTNLAPGRYVFRVIAATRTDCGARSRPRSPSSVPPTFSQTWWFRALWVPVALAAGVGVGAVARAPARPALRRSPPGDPDRTRAHRARIARHLAAKRAGPDPALPVGRRPHAVRRPARA